MATAHTGRLFSSWKLDSNLNNTSTCWKIRPKTRRKKTLHRAIWSGNIEPESIKQHPLFFLLLLCLRRDNAAPPVLLVPLYHFQCHASERGRGVGLAFCSENRCSFVLQVRKMDFSQTIPTHAWIKARLHLCWVLLEFFTYSWNIEMLFARMWKRKNTQERLKNGGMAATTKLNHSLLGLSLPNAIFYHAEMSGEQNRETEQREQHLHVRL